MSPNSSADQSQTKPMYQRQAEIVLGGIATMFILFLSLDVVEANFNPINQVISEHLHGPYRWIMFFGFLGLAIAHWMLSILLKTTFAGQIRYKLGAILLKISAIGFLIAGCFSDAADVVGNTGIESGDIHLLGSMLAFLMLFIAQLIIAFQLQKAGRLSGIYRVLPWVAVVSPIFFLLLPFDGPVGLYQRLFLIIPFGWTSLVAAGIHSNAFKTN